MSSETLIVTVDLMPALVAELHREIARIVKVTAEGLIGDYNETAPRLSGFMGDSGYVVTADGSTYGQGAGSGPMLPAVHAKAENDHTAYAAIAATYAGWVETGTKNMGAQPAFYPAVDAAEAAYAAELEGIERRLKL